MLWNIMSCFIGELQGPFRTPATLARLPAVRRATRRRERGFGLRSLMGMELCDSGFYAC